MKFLSVAFAGCALATTANPIRKVVNMLNMMSEKVEAEGKREEELFEKYQCYCKTNDAETSASIDSANQRIPQLEAVVKRSSSVKSQLQSEVKDHKADRVEGEGAIKKANSLRDKERASYESESSDAKANIKALGKAVKSIEDAINGGAAFLQTMQQSNVLQKVKDLLENSSAVGEDERSMAASFLATGTFESGGSSGEIVGILKTIQEETQKDLDASSEEEANREKAHEELTAGKAKEISSTTALIESKTERIGQLAVKVSENSDDLEESEKTLDSDTTFLAELRRGCQAQEEAATVRKKTRSEELTAIAETIKILNDDDALDLFKKTLPSPETALIQTKVTTSAVQKRVLNLISHMPSSVPLSLISLSLKTKKVDFSKISKMVDDLVVTLKQEQVDDDTHKAYCEKEFDSSDDKKKSIQRDVAGRESQKQEIEGGIQALAADIKALQAGIANLDKSVADATVQRKAEHGEYSQVLSENQASLGLIEFAKNRLQKFYNPKLYKAPAPQQLSEDDQIYSNFGGEVTTAAPGGIADTGISALQSRRPAPPAVPSASYGKSQGGNGVVAMLDNLANDLKKETQEAESEEEAAQKEYETLMADSKRKRATDSEAITSKETAKANADECLQKTVTSLDESKAAEVAVNEAITNLHGTCDFLVQNYDARKQARAQEIEGLDKAKATLGGANYSLAQKSKSFLQ